MSIVYRVLFDMTVGLFSIYLMKDALALKICRRDSPAQSDQVLDKIV